MKILALPGAVLVLGVLVASCGRTIPASAVSAPAAEQRTKLNAGCGLSVVRQVESAPRTPQYTNPNCGGSGNPTGGGGGTGSGAPGTVGQCGGSGSGGCGQLRPPADSCLVDSTQPKCQVGVIKGTPSPGTSCTQTSGSNSLPIGATVGAVNSQPRSVVDINQVDTGAGNTIVNGNTIASNLQSVGWLYLDNNGGRWFQKDPAAQWTTAINVNVNAYFGIGVTPATAQTPTYVPKQLTNPIDSNLVDIKCFTQGAGLSPGTWG